MTFQPEAAQTDVVVVGAGLAGISAARALEAAEHSVIVLEARDRVGGRTWAKQLSNGFTIDVGGQWVGPGQDHILALIDELDIPLHPTYDTGDNLSVLAEGQEPKRFAGDTFGLPPHALLDVLAAQKRLESMAKKVPLDAPWNAPKSEKWDGQTAESWIRSNLRTKPGRDFWRLVVGAVFSCEATDLSLLHFLFYCHSGGLWDKLLGTTAGAQESRVDPSLQSVSVKAAAGLDVRLNAAVRSISTNPAGSRLPPSVAVTFSDGPVGPNTPTGQIIANRVIVAVPPAVAGKIEYSPGLGGLRSQLHQSLPMGSVIKVFALYETPFWREAGLSGQAVSLTSQPSVIFDNSPADASCGVLVGFIEGKACREAQRMTSKERQKMVTTTFAGFFGEQAAEPVEYLEQDWTAEEWSGGCYGGRFTPGVWTQLGPALREPCGPIHWAGTETAEKWMGYADGAIESGKRAAAEVAAHLDDA